VLNSIIKVRASSRDRFRARPRDHGLHTAGGHRGQSGGDAPSVYSTLT